MLPQVKTDFFGSSGRAAEVRAKPETTATTAWACTTTTTTNNAAVWAGSCALLSPERLRGGLPLTPACVQWSGYSDSTGNLLGMLSAAVIGPQAPTPTPTAAGVQLLIQPVCRRRVGPLRPPSRHHRRHPHWVCPAALAGHLAQPLDLPVSRSGAFCLRQMSRSNTDCQAA